MGNDGPLFALVCLICCEVDHFPRNVIVFDPSRPNVYYGDLYERLVGIEKETVLEELVSLFSPVSIRENWSRKHYSRVLPMLVATGAKAPVIVLGGRQVLKRYGNDYI